MKTVHGSCFCEAVRFELDLPTRFAAHCHCSECRRASAAPFVTWIGVPNAQFRITAGADLLTLHGEPPEWSREFCSRCGSQLFFRGKRWENEVHITLASVAGEIDRKPQAHVYYSDRAPWMDLHAKIPTLGGPDGTTPLGTSN